VGWEEVAGPCCYKPALGLGIATDATQIGVGFFVVCVCVC
jgi:hypothetical protein